MWDLPKQTRSQGQIHVCYWQGLQVQELQEPQRPDSSLAWGRRDHPGVPNYFLGTSIASNSLQENKYNFNNSKNLAILILQNQQLYARDN